MSGLPDQLATLRGALAGGLGRGRADSGVCLWHHGRCGSSVLARLIADDGRLDWHGELLETLSLELAAAPRRQRYRAMLAQLARAHAGRATRPPGIEIKLDHLERLGVGVAAMRVVLRMLGYRRHLVLERRNHLQRHVSSLVALARGGHWHTPAGEQTELMRVHVDLAALRRDFDRQRRFFDTLRRRLPATTPWLDYETDIEQDPRSGYRRVMACLGLEARPLDVALARTNPHPLDAVVVNFDEVRRALEGTADAWMCE